MTHQTPIKILYIITTAGVGGAEMMLYKLLQRTDPDVFSPFILTLMPPGPLGERLKSLGFPMRSLDMRRSAVQPSAIWRLRELVREARPDLVHAWMYHGHLAGTLGSWFARGRVPTIWNVRHSLSDIRLEKPATRAIIKLCAKLSKQPQAIIYNAKIAAEQHEAMGYASDNRIVIPNGFDCEQLRPRPAMRRPARHRLGIADDTPLIGMIARHHPMKDPIVLFDAMLEMKARSSKAQLVICGRDFDENNAPIMNAITERGLDSRVKLLGRRDDVPDVLAALDLMVLPSAWGEGFPNVIGEAMASGVLCVATDVGECASAIGEHGRVVPPRDSTALAQAIDELLDLSLEERQRRGDAARQHVVDNFGVADIAERYHRLNHAVATSSTPADAFHEIETLTSHGGGR